MPMKLHYFLAVFGMITSADTEIVHARRRMTNCKPGYYSSATAREPCSPCSNGTWSLEAYFSCQNCTTCERGFYVTQSCAADTPAICASCPAGTFSNETDIDSCSPCTNDTWSRKGASECTECMTCPPGTYQRQNCTATQPRACKECDAGTYSSMSNAFECPTCPSGWWSTNGAANCTLCFDTCEVGHFILVNCTSKTNKRCKKCNAGTYSDTEDSLNCTACENGWWSRPGESECHNCTDCYPGHQISSNCTSTQDRQCMECPKGFYEAGENSYSCSPCINGTNWSPSGATECTNCTQCEPGHYQSVSCTFDTAGVCAVCPAGTYTSKHSEADLSYCQNCSDTSWSVEGATQCTECKSCPEGTFISQECSPKTARKCTNCPAGTYTSLKDQSTCTECGNGTYSLDGASTCENCTTCQPGHYIIANCTSGFNTTKATDTRCADCDAGYYANGTNEVSCTKCTESVNWSVSASSECQNCSECTAGHYVSRNCTITEDTGCSECKAGTYAAGTNELDCLTCASEKWSLPGASECNNCTTCEPGFYASVDCDGTRDRRCTMCEAGTYTNTTDESQCTQCRDETWSFGGAASCTQCVTCKPGFHVLVKCNATTPRRCKECDENTTSSVDNADSCTLCQQGTFSLAGAKKCTKIA